MKESRTSGHIAVPFDKKHEGRVDERSDFFETEMSVTLASQLVDFDGSKRALDGGVSKEKDVAKIAVLQSLIESAYGERDIRAVSRTQRKIAGPPSCECRQTGPSLGVPDDLDQFDHAVLLGADAGN